jgi:hypothetical protein
MGPCSHDLAQSRAVITAAMSVVVDFATRFEIFLDVKLTCAKQTDGMRGVYEKITGKKVNPKYSN